MIDAKNVVHEYYRRDEEGNITEELRALDGITLQVKEGDFIAVLGANGSGKSTFAKHLNALLVPTEGTLYISGLSSADRENALAIRQTAGMVFQNPDNQIVAPVVEEDVGFGPENLGVPTEEIWERVLEALQAVDMAAYRRQSPNRLSGGQKQRIAIAGILAMKPKCIILDEATAMLDPVGREKILELIYRLHQQEKLTVIWITHYMEEVTRADYVYLMAGGRVAVEGRPREIFARGRELRKYRISVPEVTELALCLREKGLSVPADVLEEEELVQALKGLHARMGKV